MSRLSYKQIKALEKGTHIFEHGYGTTVKSVVATDPVEKYLDGIGNQVSFVAINLKTNAEINYVFSEKYMHYSPSIYLEPAYI